MIYLVAIYVVSTLVMYVFGVWRDLKFTKRAEYFEFYETEMTNMKKLVSSFSTENLDLHMQLNKLREQRNECEPKQPYSHIAGDVK